jgi:hypothetical protein
MPLVPAASYSVDIKILYPAVRLPRSEVCQSSLSSAPVKNAWSFTSPPSICFHGEDRVNFTFFTFEKVRILALNGETPKHKKSLGGTD